MELQRILFTRDRDFLREATYRQVHGIEFCGVVYAHQIEVPIKVCISDLELICSAGTFDDVMNTLFYLPL